METYRLKLENLHCLAVLAVSSLICRVLGFWKVSRTPGWMENILLLMGWSVLRLKSTKIIDEDLAAG